MEADPSKRHWESVYQTKQANQVSWTQPVPVTSITFIEQANLPKSARIIDVGGGDSKRVDFLLDAGYEQVSVLDISQASRERAKQRLGDRAGRVNWIVKDINAFEPLQPYDFWHDRAAFHFLTNPKQISRHLTLACQGIAPAGYITLGTFPEQGPSTCSGLPVQRYSEQTLTTELTFGFRKLRCLTEDHLTTFQTTQNFLFCSFQRMD